LRQEIYCLKEEYIKYKSEILFAIQDWKGKIISKDEAEKE